VTDWYQREYSRDLGDCYFGRASPHNGALHAFLAAGGSIVDFFKIKEAQNEKTTPADLA